MLFLVLIGGYVMAQEETIPLQEETEPAQEVTVLNQVVPIDHIVAVVNEEVITRNDVNDLIESTVKQLQKQGTRLPPYDVLEKQLPERLIMARNQLQRAKEIGISVSDTALDQTLRNI